MIAAGSSTAPALLIAASLAAALAGCAGAPEVAGAPPAAAGGAAGAATTGAAAAQDPASERPPQPLAVTVLRADGSVARVTEPRARRVDRRADLEPNATLIAPDVALVVEPASGAPAYVSNMLGGALTRRFAGHTPIRRAVAAPEVFIAVPVATPPAAVGDDLLVDWKILAAGRRPVGAVFARRKLSGPAGASPWSALTAEDAEHIALQTAAAIEGTQAIRDAIERAAGRARLDRTPTPAARPEAEG